MKIRFGKKMRITAAAVLTSVAAFTIASCTRTTSAAGAPPPPVVEVASVEQRDVPIYREWIGTLDGLVNAAIRAQVTGYLRSQNYTEGSFVRKGQLLFQIDPRPFQDAVDQVQGQLAQANGQLAQAKAQLIQAQAQLTAAEASQHRTQLDVDKYTPLNKQKAITQQEMDDATQNNLSAKAQVEAAKAQVETAKAQIQAASAGVVAAKAALETARVNLGFTRLTSPIDGIAGVAQIQIGNLVSQTANPVTTVSTLDPIKVNFAVSDQEYLQLRRLDTPLNRLELELILSDGTVYPHKGKFDFVDRQVTANTGAIQMTALFPNPGNILRPGQYGKVRAETGTTPGALLVPQPAVTELQGSYEVAVVDDKNRVSIQPVKVGRTVGSMWVISDGLKRGQRVIVEGAQKAVAGATVNPKPFKNDTESVEGN
ncbi:MAG TPA: efflux RND transporter periplasmic adaptor subunit [Bryobacteraceae bacterium]|nr:efflux RND transporter periplasmic adaptor subunit [Bryobacteraceae bacterium]